MMPRRVAIVAGHGVAGALLLATMPVAAAGRADAGMAPSLHNNPFKKLAIQPEPRREARPPATTPPAPWAPPLKATVMAGKGSLVNVDGEILGLGEAHEGYRLVEVRERTAVFERGGRHYVLSLDARVAGDAPVTEE